MKEILHKNIIIGSVTTFRIEGNGDPDTCPATEIKKR